MLRLVTLFLSAVVLHAATAPPTLEQTKPERVISLEGAIDHVQGILVEGDVAYVTAVDRKARKGYVHVYSLAGGKQLKSVEVHEGDMYHPGGLDGDQEFIYVPVAEYRANSKAVVQKRRRGTLELVSSFPVPDHIGAAAVGPDRLYLANWDARKIYEYTAEGKLLRARDNPTEWRFQDFKYRNGLLVGSGMVPRPRTDHSVVWLDPETLGTVKSVVAGFSDRKVTYVHEGLDSVNGTIYTLPEDAPSRIFVFDALYLANLNKPERQEWLRDLGFGMFIHWNVDVNLGSVISHSLVGADKDYVERYFRELPRYLNPKKLDAKEWARLAKLAGMKYVVFTTKHHAGFAWWDTKTTPFNIMNTPFQRDVVREVVAAFRAESLAIGFYISPDDFWWFHTNGLSINRPPAKGTTTRELPGLMEYGKQQLRELLTNYGKIDILFIDGPAHGLREEAWRLQPDLIVTRGAIETPEQHVPGIPSDSAWEACITVGDAWQHKPADNPKPSKTLIETLVEIRAKGGNLLLNVGPRPDGEISQEEEARLRDIALWHFVNGEALDAVRPWVITNEGDIWFTKRKNENTVYAFVTRSPWKLGERREVLIRSVRATPQTRVSVLGQSDEILEYRPDIKPETRFKQTDQGLSISAMTAQRMYDDRRWDKPVVLKITNVEAALVPPQVTTLAPSGGKLRGELVALGDAKEVEVGFEVRPRKGLTDLYEKTEPWRALPLVKRAATGVFELAAPEGDLEYRAVVKHPLLTLYGAERPAQQESAQR